MEVRERFAANLRAAMGAKGWSNSDLARAVWGERVNNAGHREARNRDRVAEYLAARGFPSDDTMEKMVEVLETTRERLVGDLVPGRNRSNDTSTADPFFSMEATPTGVRLRLDAVLRLEDATEIFKQYQRAIRKR
jgi:hypothetical protein